MKTFFLLAAAVLLGLPSLPAAEPDFSVTIVGSRQGQEHYFSDAQARGDHGFPVIQLPVRPPPTQEIKLDEASSQGTHFYVVVRNISKSPVRLDLTVSSWYYSLAFSLTAADGKTFPVDRPPTAWAANPVESWIFQPEGERIFAVDFTTGRWQGLPPYDSVRSRAHFTMTAHFRYYDWETKKYLDFHSGPIEVETGPR